MYDHKAPELHRRISATVRDMPSAHRIQAQPGPVTDRALEQILFLGGRFSRNRDAWGLGVVGGERPND